MSRWGKPFVLDLLAELAAEDRVIDPVLPGQLGGGDRLQPRQ